MTTIRRGAAGLLLTALMAAPAAAGAQTPDAPVATIIPDVVYGHKDGMALTFDVLQPPEPNGAAVLYMVSGGWVSRWVDPRALAERSFRGLLEAGFTVIAVRHGSSPRYKVPEAEADVRMALRHVRENAATWAVDPDRLGVFGGSAGGHLSLMLGLRADGEEPGPEPQGGEAPSGVAAVVAYYPPVDLRGMAGPSERFPALDFPPELAPSISPILYVSPGDPPTLLIHGDADRLVPHRNSEVLHAAFQEAGAESEMVIIPGGDHGFTRPEDRSRAQSLMVEWFTRHLGGEGGAAEASGARSQASRDFPVSPALPAESRQFDFWIGEWDVNLRVRQDDLTWADEVRSVAKIYPILRGKAVLELWSDVREAGIEGYSLRYFDTARDEWVIWLNWPGPDRSGSSSLSGSFRHGRGEFFASRASPDGGETISRYTFSDITPESLRWDDAFSSDGGATWTHNWIMEFTRAGPKPTLSPRGGPEHTYHAGDRCDAPEFRDYELLGSRMTGEIEAGGDGPVTITGYRILDGCAVMTFAGAAGDPESAFAFSHLTWNTYVDRYELTTLTSDADTPVRMFYSRGRELVFYEEVEGDRAPHRFRIEPRGDGVVTWAHEIPDGDGWRPVWQATVGPG